MGDKLIQFLVGLSQRERWLMAVMLLVALPLGFFYGVALPLSEARDQARRDVAEAQAIESWVAAQGVRYATLGPVMSGEAKTTNFAPIGISGIESSLVEAGLRRDVSELANSADGGITLRFADVRFTTLADWMSATSEGWGYDLASFAFKRGKKDDFVEAEFRLVPAS